MGLCLEVPRRALKRMESLGEKLPYSGGDLCSYGDLGGQTDGQVLPWTVGLGNFDIKEETS